MKIDVSVPGSASDAFLLYLISQLKKCQNGGFGVGYEKGQLCFSNNCYETIISGCYLISGSLLDLTWKFVREIDGCISVIFVEFLDEELERLYGQEVNNIIHKAYSSLLGQKQTKYFRRNIYTYYGPIFSGEYWLSGYRFAPIVDDFNFPALMGVERVACIDMIVDAVDEEHANDLADYNSSIFANRISLLAKVALRRHDSRSVWVLEESDGWRVKRLQRALPTILRKGPMPKRGAECRAGSYDRSVGQFLRYASQTTSTLPKETRKILQKVKNDDQFRVLFDTCARTYRLALMARENSITQSLSYQVAAVEAVAQQTRHKDFSTFMRHYAAGFQDLERILRDLYHRVRSAHFHAGSIGYDYSDSFLSEFFDFEMFEKRNFVWYAEQAIWMAISGWMLENIESTR